MHNNARRIWACTPQNCATTNRIEVPPDTNLPALNDYFVSNFTILYHGMRMR